MTSSRKVDRWIQRAKPKKGALSRQLGIPEEQNIPMKTLNRVIETDTGNKVYVGGRWRTVTPLMKRRANFARTVKRF